MIGRFSRNMSGPRRTMTQYGKWASCGWTASHTSDFRENAQGWDCPCGFDGIEAGRAVGEIMSIYMGFTPPLLKLKWRKWHQLERFPTYGVYHYAPT